MKLEIDKLLVPAQAGFNLLTNALGVKKEEIVVSCEAGKRLKVQLFPNVGSPFGLKFEVKVEEPAKKPFNFAVDHDVFFSAIGGRKGFISLSVSNSELHFVNGRLKGRMPCMPFKSQSFPSLKPDKVMDRDFFELMAKAVGSCNITSTSPLIFVSCKQGELKVMTSSDYQMAVARYQVGKKPKIEFALPPTHFQAIKQLSDGLEAQELDFQFDDHKMSLQIGKTCTALLPTVVIDQEKLQKMEQLLQLLEKNSPAKGSVVQANRLLTALKSAGAVSDVGTHALLIGKNKGIEVEVSSGHGHIRDLVAVESETGKPMNGKYRVDPVMMQQSLSRFNTPVLRMYAKPPAFTLYEATKEAGEKQDGNKGKGKSITSSVLHVGRLVDEV